MIMNKAIIDGVLTLRLQGMTIPQIAHTLSREHPRYCKRLRKQKNIASPDVLRIIEHLKAEGRLPLTALDSLKTKIGQKGRSNPKLQKPRKKVATPPTFNF